MNEMIMDNSGRGPLRVPGFGGIPIEHVLDCEGRFAHGTKDWQQMPAVTARELAMVGVMNTLTDKMDWQVKVFDDSTVADWREDAFATTPLMSDKAWTWCLAELRDKASDFDKNQYLRVLDTGSCICKSDTLVPEYLSAEFKSGVARLLEQTDKDWEPRYSGRVSNLVDPSMFPLVYGRSLVLTDGEQVKLDNVLGYYGQAEVAPGHFDKRIHSSEVQRQIEDGRGENCRIYPNGDDSELGFYHWSSNFQWLPSEVEFINESGTDIHITSYINNLHPTHQSLYRAIEKLISLAIKPWNDCLIKGQQGWNNESNQGQRGPVPLRIITYGIEWENDFPEWAMALKRTVIGSRVLERRVEAKKLLQDTPDIATGEIGKKRLEARTLLKKTSDMEPGEKFLDLKEPTPEILRMTKDYLELPIKGSTVPEQAPLGWEKDPWTHVSQKHERLQYWKHPDPGTAFSYEDWKSGNNNQAVIDMVPEWPNSTHYLPVNPDHKLYAIRLQETFRKQGLQIIIKIDGIELTPTEPTYHGGNWQLQGQLNEHIVATAMYAYDVKNVTETRISFRQETPIYPGFYRYGKGWHKENSSDSYPPAHMIGKHKNREIAAITEILGFQEAELHELASVSGHEILPFQNIGSITTPQSRLVTFPNMMEHRIEPFKLVDPNLPGYHRSVILYLVDPNYRVCSTRNVPPQQHDWWAEAMGDALLSHKVPPEIAAEITGRTGEWPMGIEEAKKLRLELLKERRWAEMARYTEMSRYNFS